MTTPRPEADRDGGVPKERCTVCRQDHLAKELQQYRRVLSDRLVFRCSICGGDYLSKEELWDHQDLHEAADGSKEPSYEEMKIRCRLYKCLLCTGHRVYQDSFYWSHIHDSHDGCGRRNETANLALSHNSNDTSVPHEQLNVTTIKSECPICDEVFSSWSLLSKHINQTHRMVVCNDCTMAFTDEHELQAHKCSTSSASQHNTQNHINSDILHCSKQNNSEHSKGSDIKYQVNSHNNANPIVKMEISVEETELQMQNDHNTGTHRQKDLENIDHETFNDQDSFSATDQRFDIKEESTEEDNALVTPMDSDDSMKLEEQLNKQPTDCPICGLTFASDTRMRYHRRINHTDPRYKCSYCPKMFHVKHMLARHETTHQGEQNVTCKLCSETYRNEMRLQRHLKIAHSMPCDLCELKFTSNTKVERHKRKYHKESFTVDRRQRVKLPGTGPKPKVWNSNQMQEAIVAVVSQQCGISQASTQYGVPKGTLYDNILGKDNRMNVLHELPFSPEEEDAILNFACLLSPGAQSKRAIRSLCSILEFMSQFPCFQEKAEQFKFGGIPGFKWWWAFCRKHSIDPPRSLFDGRKRPKFDDTGNGRKDLI
ncbi:zinc finger protein 345 [Aedes albopictus]|uniref:C2H2-type domain-containing protein n=1 Tax=Aedes albopictus TaxID=7160 RepID=A0ABM1XZV3_AEDAL|nr:zinc finger protein 345-like [Aedes albopictus]